MQFTTLALFGLAGFAAAATNSTASPVAASCQKTFNGCTGSATDCNSALSACQATCNTAYSNCRTAADANMATCAAQYAGCLGTNPFAANGTNTVTAGAIGAGGVTYVTDVVTAYTTYCPFATQVTQNGIVYTATASQTLTITNCPCTVTKAVTQPTGSMTSTPAASTGASNGTSSYKPQAFTGAGNKAFAAGGSLVAAGAAAVFFL